MKKTSSLAKLGQTPVNRECRAHQSSRSQAPGDQHDWHRPEKDNFDGFSMDSLPYRPGLILYRWFETCPFPFSSGVAGSPLKNSSGHFQV